MASPSRCARAVSYTHLDVYKRQQDALGDVVFVDLPEVGKSFAQGEVAGVVESVKAAADVYMPCLLYTSQPLPPCSPRP